MKHTASAFWLSLVGPVLFAQQLEARGESAAIKQGQSGPNGGASVALPKAPLKWGDLNVIHTTDTHGWLRGHQKAEDPESNYSGDFGDVQSFVIRMKEEAARRGKDLLLVDSGDLHDGNGLSDAEPIAHPGHVRGSTSNRYFFGLPYDILAIGNHELYDIKVAQDMNDNFAPFWGDKYITSNVNITTSGKSKSLGSRFRKFTTAQGRSVTTLGALVDFHNNAKGTIVIPVSEMVTESWFREAIQERPDVFLLVAHMGVRDDDWKLIFGAIRALHPDTPIMIFGGHVHVRDCVQLDAKSMSMGSGKYLDTIGWMSVEGLDAPEKGVKFDRRYLDQNRATYLFHTSLSPSEFNTPEGIRTSASMAALAASFNLTYPYGHAPQSYYLARVPPTDPSSIAHLLTGPGGVLETVVVGDQRERDALVAMNTGGIRFDIFRGDFTVNDQWITFPFYNDWSVVERIPRGVAKQLVGLLNEGGVYLSAEEAHLRATAAVAAAAEGAGREQLAAQKVFALAEGDAEELTYGHVTEDLCPGNGDDTRHKPLPKHPQPDYIGTSIDGGHDDDLVDFVFISFVQEFALAALNKAQQSRVYRPQDVRAYPNALPANQMLGEYATRMWR